MNEKNIGSIINKLREEAGLTQKDLAAKLCISDKAISKWETNTNLPPLDMIYKISTLFNVSFQNLLKVRLEDEHVDEKVIKNIMDEFDESNKRKEKIIKIAIMVLLVVTLILIIVLHFTQTYNKFDVYNMSVNSDEIYADGIYIETRIKDSLTLNNLRLRKDEVKSSDTISIDIYYVDIFDKEILLYTSERLEDLTFSNYQTLVKTDDLTKYINNMYVRITIIGKDDNVKKYIGKLNFAIDFSNNIDYGDKMVTSYNDKKLDKDYVKERLLDNGFKENNSNNLVKSTNEYRMIYYYDSNKLTYRYEKNNFSYRYTYNFDLATLEILVFDENNVEIENYEYNVNEDNVTICKVGRCNDARNAMKLLNQNVLNYLYNE